MNALIGILTAVHVVVALFLIVLVLMQKSSEQGVGAAFGGGMTESVFGAGTTTALVRMTIWCACMLLATTLILTVLHSHRGRTSGSLVERVLTTTPVAPASQTPPPLTFPTTTTPSAPTTSEAPVTVPSSTQTPPPPVAPAEATP